MWKNNTCLTPRWKNNSCCGPCLWSLASLAGRMSSLCEPPYCMLQGGPGLRVWMCPLYPSNLFPISIALVSLQQLLLLNSPCFVDHGYFLTPQNLLMSKCLGYCRCPVSSPYLIYFCHEPSSDLLMGRTEVSVGNGCKTSDSSKKCHSLFIQLSFIFVSSKFDLEFMHWVHLYFSMSCVLRDKQCDTLGLAPNIPLTHLSVSRILKAHIENLKCLVLARMSKRS